MSRHAHSILASMHDTFATSDVANLGRAGGEANHNGAAVINGTTGNDVLNGGNGNEIINGLAGNDVLSGGNGDDTLVGGTGADQMLGGRGDDLLVWNQGDGSDVLDGGKGYDTMLFNGFGNAETFNLSAKPGGGSLLTRDLGNIVMDQTSVEKIILNPLGGADKIHVNDLTGSGITEFDINLGLNGAGDGAADQIFIQDATVHVVDNGGGNIDITGVTGATIHITGFETANDQLIINGNLFHF